MRSDLSDIVMAVSGKIVRFVVYAALFAPVFIVIATSFTASATLRFPPEGFSLRWYEAALGSPQFMGALWVSVRLALAATVISLILGFAATFAADRFEFPGRAALRALLLSPLVVPMVVLGLGLLQFLAWVGLAQTFWGLLLGHILITLPYVARTLAAGTVLFDRRLEEAAMNLRAAPLTVLRRITLPLLAPSIVAAGVFAFVTSFGNITLSVFLSFGGEMTLPVQIYSYVESNYTPIIASVSTLVIVITVILLVSIEKLVGMERLR